MSDDDDDGPELTYLPYIIPVLIIEYFIVNFFLFYDWRNQLISSGVPNIPLFSRPQDLSWLTPCPWDNLSGTMSGEESFSVRKCLWGKPSWDLLLFIFRLLAVTLMFIFGCIINLSRYEPEHARNFFFLLIIISRNHVYIILYLYFISFPKFKPCSFLQIGISL